MHRQKGPPRGKCDGVIGQISMRENENRMKKIVLLRDRIDQSGIQHVWVNLT